MRAIHAIYENGRVQFSFSYPDYQGPVSILVIFPDMEEFDFGDFDDLEESEVESC